MCLRIALAMAMSFSYVFSLVQKCFAICVSILLEEINLS